MRPMSKRRVIKALRLQQCRKLRDTGRHEVWGCPCDKHITAVPRHRQISKGVLRNIIDDLKCLPEGWLR